MLEFLKIILELWNLFEKFEKLYNKSLARKYKKHPYFFSNYNKKTYINKNGDGIVFMSCDMVVLDKTKTKHIKAKLDITDAKTEAVFPSFNQMNIEGNKMSKEAFKDCYFKVWSNDSIITSVKESYDILPQKDRNEWKRSNKRIALKINLNSNMLEEKKMYKISYMFSVPGMFPIQDGYYCPNENQDDNEMVSSLDIEEYIHRCKYSLYMSKDIAINDKVDGFINESSIESSKESGVEQQEFGFYSKHIMDIKQANKYRNIGFSWKVKKSSTTEKGDIDNGEIVPVLNAK